ncbi:MAG: hypothetical protein LC732_01465, partial [Acidobacteria bacterium]|nr:hypothetical protein [Acidobacteriota bacterium]
RGGGDAVASLTTSDAEIARNLHQPFGLRATRPLWFLSQPLRRRSVAEDLFLRPPRHQAGSCH